MRQIRKLSISEAFISQRLETPKSGGLAAHQHKRKCFVLIFAKFIPKHLTRGEEQSSIIAGDRLAEEDTRERCLVTIMAMIRDKRRGTAIEYALIATAILLAIVPPMAVIATGVDGTYQQILSYFDDI